MVVCCGVLHRSFSGFHLGFGLPVRSVKRNRAWFETSVSSTLLPTSRSGFCVLLSPFLHCPGGLVAFQTCRSGASSPKATPLNGVRRLADATRYARSWGPDQAAGVKVKWVAGLPFPFALPSASRCPAVQRGKGSGESVVVPCHTRASPCPTAGRRQFPLQAAGCPGPAAG